MRNASNFVASPGEKFTLPSMTVPDQTVDLREMLNRHLNGGAVKQYVPIYQPPDSIVPAQYELMSKVERSQLLKDTSDFIATTRGRIQTARDAATRAEHERIIAQRASDLLSKQAEGSASST